MIFKSRLNYIYIMKLVLIAFILILKFSAYCEQEAVQPQIEIIIKEFAQPLQQWVGYNRSAVQVAKECKMEQFQSQLLNFHKQLAETGQDFTRQHIDAIRKVFKDQHDIKIFFKCMTEKRNTQNQFFKEQKKYKYLAQFIKQFPLYASEMFYARDKPIDKGYRLGRFFRAFFQYYYQHVLHPAETASTKLIRAMTTRIDLFQHQDISNCFTLETSGKIAQNLQNIGIHNIYINIPEAFNALKYMKFKQNCKKQQKYALMLQQIHRRLQKIDMFKVMYHEYNPWVEIAAQKYGNRQIQYVAKVFCQIVNNQKHYEELSAIEQF